MFHLVRRDLLMMNHEDLGAFATELRAISREAVEVTPEDRPPPEYVDHLYRQGFQLTELLGRGRTGRVFEATQGTLSRLVAVKFCDGLGTGEGSKVRDRFRREAELLARVESPHLPYVVTRGEVEQVRVPYYVMQYIPGEDLKDVMAERHLRPEQSLQIVRQVLTALASAHRLKVMHRDVSPYNVRIWNGTAWLLDFSLGGWTSPHTTLTEVGEFVGRWDYSAPEQNRGAVETDARTDVHQAGRLLFHLLTNRSEIRLEKLDEDLRGFLPEITEVVRKACAEHPTDRFANASEFLAALPNAPRWDIRTRSGRAICPNTTCPGAEWDREGYYLGPRIIDNSDNEFCGLCTERLVYDCPTCGKAVGDEPFCGCRTQLFLVPRCDSCGLNLKRDEAMHGIGSGCSRCIAF